MQITIGSRVSRLIEKYKQFLHACESKTCDKRIRYVLTQLSAHSVDYYDIKIKNENVHFHRSTVSNWAFANITGGRRLESFFK